MDDGERPTAEDVLAFIQQTFSRDGIQCGPVGHNCVDIIIPSTFTNHTFLCRKLDEEFNAIVHRNAVAVGQYTVTLPAGITVKQTDSEKTTVRPSSNTYMTVVLTLGIVLCVGMLMVVTIRLWPLTDDKEASATPATASDL